MSLIEYDFSSHASFMLLDSFIKSVFTSVKHKSIIVLSFGDVGLTE